MKIGPWETPSTLVIKTVREDKLRVMFKRGSEMGLWIQTLWPWRKSMHQRRSCKFGKSQDMEQIKTTIQVVSARRWCDIPTAIKQHGW